VAYLIAGCHTSSSGRSTSNLNVALVAKRVAQLRGLQFRRVPRLAIVNRRRMARLVSTGLSPSLGPSGSDYVRGSESGEIRIFTRLEALELLGAIPGGTTASALLDGGVSTPVGFFDPATGVISLYRVPGRSDRGLEAVLAHELTHALEQEHALRAADAIDPANADLMEARDALAEGSAVAVEFLYRRRYQRYRGTLSQYVATFEREALRRKSIPPFLVANLLFPYTDGAKYVYRLSHEGTSWTKVNDEERHPPSSTAAILSGSSLGSDQEPRVPTTAVPGRTWHNAGEIVLGDFETDALLSRRTTAPDPVLARGWAGGAIRIWTDLSNGTKVRCRRPCASHFVLIAAWRWRTARAAAYAQRRLATYAQRVLRVSTGSGGIGRTTPGSRVLVTRRGMATALVLAPRPGLAARVAHAIAKQLNGN
jgi:hypothetical protein